MPLVARLSRVLIPLFALSAACSTEVPDAPEPPPNLPRSTVIPSDDDIDGNSPLVVRWTFEELSGSWGDLSLPLTVASGWEVPLEAEIFAYVRTPGIDEDSETEIPIASGSFDPQETIELALPTESMPSLTPGLPVIVRVVAHIQAPQEQGISTVRSEPRLVEIDPSHETVTAGPRKRYESIEEALYDASRPFFEPQYAKSPIDPPIANGPRGSYGLAVDVRICPDWRVAYRDNQGETFVNSAMHQRVPASFAKLSVHRPSAPLEWWLPGPLVFEEILDEDGCTSVRPIDTGEYVMVVHTQFEKDEVLIDVEWDDEPIPELDIGWSGAAFRVYGAGDIHRLTGSNDNTTRAARRESRRRSPTPSWSSRRSTETATARSIHSRSTSRAVARPRRLVPPTATSTSGTSMRTTPRTKSRARSFAT